MVKHWVVIVIELSLCALVLFVCQWLPDVGATKNRISMALSRTGQPTKLQRRLSVDNALNAAQRPRKRRPSEEALRISGSTHQELLIQDASRKNSRAENRRRRRKKKEQLMVTAAPSMSTTYVNEGPVKRVVLLNSERKYDEKVVNGDKEDTVQSLPLPPPPPPMPPTNLLEHSNSRITDTNGPSLALNINGNSKSLPLPAPPQYVQTALSFRKQRNSHRSSSELTDSSKDKSSNNSSSSVKKSGPFKKIVKKFF